MKKCVLAAGLFVAALSPCIATAALGEPEVSVQADGVELRGSVKVMARLSYRVHEIQLPSGNRVREFAHQGTVFAVAWNGPTMPDLRHILGRYFDSYVSAAKANRAGHHHLQIHQDDLVVIARGHMREFSGQAYLPQALPSGVNAGELQ